jgi:hypothetical protein
MAGPVIANPLPQIARETESFLDRNFIKIAFAISTLAMAVLVPMQFFLGAAIGFILHSTSAPLRYSHGEKLTVSETLFTIVGATAALLRLTPAGAAGGLIFQAVPFIGAMPVGFTAYRTFQNS